MGVDYTRLAAAAAFDELLLIADSINWGQVRAVHDWFAQSAQRLANVGSFGKDVDDAGSDQVLGRFIDAAREESASVSRAAEAMGSSAARLALQLGFFLDQQQNVLVAAHTLRTAVDSHTPSGLAQAAQALAKALSSAYADFAGKPVINATADFADARVASLGADGKAAGPSPSDGPGGNSGGQLSSSAGALGQLGSAADGLLQGMAQTESGAAQTAASLASPFAGAGLQNAENALGDDEALGPFDPARPNTSSMAPPGPGSGTGTGSVVRPLTAPPPGGPSGSAATPRPASVSSAPAMPAPAASMMGMPMTAHSGLGRAGTAEDRRTPEYLVTQQHGEQLVSDLPSAAQPVLGGLDAHELLEMLAASAEDA